MWELELQRGNLSLDGNVVKGETLIVPEMQKQIIKVTQGQRAAGYSALCSCAILAWDVPEHNRDGELNCELYSTHQKRQNKKPLHPNTVPEQPQQKMGVNLFTCDQQQYLLLVDYFKFKEILLTI